MYVCVYVCVCVCVYMYVFMYVCMYVCMYVYIYNKTWLELCCKNMHRARLEFVACRCLDDHLVRSRHRFEDANTFHLVAADLPRFAPEASSGGCRRISL